MHLNRWLPAVLASLLTLGPHTGAIAAEEAPADTTASIQTQLDDTEVTLQADGSSIRRITKRYLILNERGKRLYSEAEFGYRPDTETVTIDRAFTVDPEGQNHPLQDNAIADGSPYSDQPAYDRYRVKSFTLPATVPGSICEYQVTIRSKKSNTRFSDSRYLQGTEPADTVRYTLVTPASLTVRTAIVNPRSDVAVTSETVPQGRLIRRSWTATTPRPLISERQMPKWRDIATRVSVSTVPSWQSVVDEWHRLSEGKDHATPALVNLAKQLTAKCGTPEEKARAIYDYVRKDVRYVAVDMTVAGFEPQSASQVWQNRYGDCKDGSTLLKTLLRLAGIPTRYALVSTNERGRLDRDLPSISQFDHCIVAADLPSGRVFLDSVGKTTSFGDLPSMDHGADALLVGDRDYEIVSLPRTQPAANAVVSEQRLTLLPTGAIKATVKEAFTGTLASSERQTYVGRTSKQISEEFRRQSESLVAGSRLLDHRFTPTTELDRPFETTFSYQADDFATVAGDLLIFKLPGVGFGLGLFSAEKREQPITWSTTERYVDRAEVMLPDGYRPRYLPTPLTLNSPEVRFSAHYAYRDGKLTFEAVTDYKSPTVMQSAYDNVRRLFLERARFGKSVIILEKESTVAKAATRRNGR
jgi:transglutaminase-like putative cysteine protease